MILTSTRKFAKALLSSEFNTFCVKGIARYSLLPYDPNTDAATSTNSTTPGKKPRFDISKVDQSGDDKLLKFREPRNLLERIVFGLKLHRLPSVVLNRQCNTIYYTCEEAFELNKDFFIDECGLPDNFQTWFFVTQLHIWMAMVRIRAEPNARKVNQYLVNRFFNGVEHKIRDYGITSERIVAKTCKEMIEAFRGGNLAYDEGMCKSDAVLAAALWRNILTTANGSIKDKQVAYLVRYVRQQLAYLDSLSSKLIYNGLVDFTPPEAKI